MRLKLSESGQPINRLEQNISKNILPKFNNYGIKFNKNPNQINKYKNMYTGVGEGLICKLYLNTTNPIIDDWNENNSDLYVADLYGELKMNGKIEQLGPLSSKDSSSVDEAMKEINVSSNKMASDEEIENGKVYPPKSKSGSLKPMTKKQWINMKNALENELNEIKAQLQKADEEDDDETYYNLYKYTYKDKRDYFDKVFMPNYPFI